jgi:hypothetical protein
MLSVVSSDVSEGWIKGGLAEAPATKQTKEHYVPCITSHNLESSSYGGMNLKSEPSAAESENPSSTPSSQWPACDENSAFFGSGSPDHFCFIESPAHSPGFLIGEQSPRWIQPGSRSESFDLHVADATVADAFMFPSSTCGFPFVKFEAVANFLGDCSQVSAESCSQASVPFTSTGDHFRSFSQNSFPLSTGSSSCQGFEPGSSCNRSDATCHDFEGWDVTHTSLPVNIVAITAKTNLSIKKVDLEKLCEMDGTHFGCRVANLKTDCSPETPRQSQDFRNSIQYLLQFPPALCEESCNKKEKFTGRIFNNGTVTISSIKTQNDIIGTVGQCLQTVVEQIRMAHDASVAVGSVVLQNLEAGCLTFADPQFSINLTFPLGFLVNYSKLRSIFKQGDEFVGLDDTKIFINSAKEEQKCGQGVFLKVTQSKLKFPDDLFHSSFTIFHTGTVQARATCKNLEEMEFLLTNMYHILNLHRSEIMPAGPEEEFISKRRARRQIAAVARSHPYADVPAKTLASRKRKQSAHA